MRLDNFFIVLIICSRIDKPKILPFSVFRLRQQKERNVNEEKQDEIKNTPEDCDCKQECTDCTEENTSEEKNLQELYDEKCKQLEQEKEHVLRVIAESENLKKRLEREKDQFCRFATSSLIDELLPVLDTLEMAITHGAKDQACASLLEGVKMTLTMFFKVLEKQGVESIGEVGEEFDPNFHEAMGQMQNEELENDKIGSLLQRGYRQKDRLLRPAKVLVNKLAD